MKYKMVMGYRIPDTGKWWKVKMVTAGIIAGLFSTIVAYVFYKKNSPRLPSSQVRHEVQPDRNWDTSSSILPSPDAFDTGTISLVCKLL